MASHADYMQGQVDIAFLSSATPWPEDLNTAVAKAQEIPGSKWRSYETIHRRTGVFLAEYVKIMDMSCLTSFGQRQFHVWEQRDRLPYPRNPYQFAVIKDYNFNTLVVHCKLRCHPGGLTADYYLCSGRCFAAHTFQNPIVAINVQDIHHTAMKLALQNQVLESRTQPMELLLEGFDYPLPSKVSVWSLEAALAQPEGETASLKQQQPLNQWMAYLKTLSFDELDELSQVNSAQRLNRFLGFADPMNRNDYALRHGKRARPQRHPDSESTSDMTEEDI